MKKSLFSLLIYQVFLATSSQAFAVEPLQSLIEQFSDLGNPPAPNCSPKKFVATQKNCNFDNLYKRFQESNGRTRSTQLMVDALNNRDKISTDKKMISDTVTSLNNYAQSFTMLKGEMAETLDELGSGGDKSKIKSLKNRLNSVRICYPAKSAQEEMKDPMGTCPFYSKCSSGSVAAYDPSHHTMILCPTAFAIPPKFLGQVILHELAHSFDPCILQGNNLLLVEKANKQMSIPYPKELTVDINYFKQDNWNINVFEKAIPVQANPFKKLIDCIGSKDGGKFRIKGTSTDKSTPEDEKYCLDETDLNVKDQSQLGESFADLFAAKAMEHYYQKVEKAGLADQDDDDLNNLAPIGFLLTSYDFFQGIGKDESLDNEHPAVIKRIVDLLLKEPAIANKLGCTPLPNRCE